MATPQSAATAAGKTVYSVDSRGTIEVNLADLMIGGELPIFREVEERGLLSLRFQKRKAVIAAGGFIGLIPLTPTVTIEINPKLPVRNLARVLDVARSSLTPLATADRLYLTNDDPTDSILEFLGRNLLDAAKPLELFGLHKEYLRSARSTSHPSGRIDISSSLKKHWSRGQLHRVVAQRFEQASDVPVNRVIKYALQFLLQRLRSTSPTSLDLIRRANQAFNQLPGSIGEMAIADLQDAKTVIQRRLLPTQRDYYYRALEIAVLILSNGGIALQEKGSDVLLRSFVVNFDDLFECYIRRVLQSFASNEIGVFDGNNERRKYLFQNTKIHHAQPDIVISSNVVAKTVVSDVKYKDLPKREDINQAVTYAVSYGTDRTLIIHQVRPGSPSGLKHIGVLGGISVDAYGFDLNSTDLPKEERAMADAIFALLT
jgi:5-methylcytosine-specific restriction enzyme subunit McrC